MKKIDTVDKYFNNQEKYKKPLLLLRAFLLQTELTEKLKWNAPIYCLKNKNIVGLLAFNNYFGLWFFNGSFLKDKYKLLQNAQEGKTKGMRQLKYSTIEEINIKIVEEYVLEAIENQKLGKEIKFQKKTLTPSIFMKRYFKKDKELFKAFNQLTQSFKNEYITYILEAKKEETKAKRMDKIIPMILNKKGLNDKYKK